MNDRKRSGPDGAAMLLSAIFAFCMAAVLLAGAQIYIKQTRESSLLWEERTGCQFLAAKLRQAASESLSVVSFGDGDALSIAQSSEYGDFETLIYCHEGMLMELFTEPGIGAPADGEPIVPASGLKLWAEDGLVSVSLLEASGRQASLKFCLRGE